MKDASDDSKAATAQKQEGDVWRDLAVVGDDIAKIYARDEKMKQEAQEKYLGTSFSILDSAKKEITSVAGQVEKEAKGFGDYVQKGWDGLMDDLDQLNPFNEEADKRPRVGRREKEVVPGVKSEKLPDKETQQLSQRSDAIYDACGVFKNDNEAIFRALGNTTLEQRQKMDKDFYSKHGQHIEDYLKDEMKRHPEMRDKALGMLKSKEKVAYHEIPKGTHIDVGRGRFGGFGG